MRRRLHELLSDRRGVTAVEFAFIGPVFLTLLVGSMEFGRFVWTTSTLQHIAREGTRYALVQVGKSASTATESITSLVKSRAVGLFADDLTVTVNWDPANSSGATVTVRVTYPFDFMVPLVPLEPLSLEGASSMVLS